MRNNGLIFFGALVGMLALSAGSVGCGDDDESGSGGATAASTSASTSDATTATGTGGSTTSSTSTGGADPDCQTYCDTIAANCTDANTQYASMEACMGACAAFDLGTAADTSGNTVGCRTYHAGAAAMDAAVHCVHAGPGGAGACGTNCEGFCAIAKAACTGANQQFADDAECATACAAFDDTEPYDATDAAGATLACHLYHLTVASSDAASADTHCGHIVDDPAGPCN